MAAITTFGSLGDSQELIIDSARITREFVGTYKRTCENQKLDDNTGASWEEITLGQLTAQGITETTQLDNPQEITDSIITSTPQMVGIEICVTDRAYRRLPKTVIAKMGPLAQNAINRKADEDYIAMFATATTTLAGTGQSLTGGHISAGKVRIRSNVTEGALGEIHCVHHGFPLKDIADEIRSGVGTYAIPAGMTEQVYRNGFDGMVDGVHIWEDGNIAINSTPDARGVIHAKEALLHIQGKSAWTEKRRRPDLGGGADEIFYYDEYSFLERSAGNWMFGLLNDATAPTS